MTAMPRNKSLTQAATVARFTIKEAIKNRLAWLAVAVAGGGLGLAAFLGEITVTETEATTAVLVGEFYRLAAAFLLSAFVITSMVREFNDKILELLLALPMTRSAYLFGKFAGFGTVALAFALVFSLPLAFFADPGQTALWGASLAIELLILAALCLLCVFTFSHAVPALGSVFAAYFLARSTTALQLMAHGPFKGGGALQDVMTGFIDFMAMALPRLDRFARGDWLAYGTGSAGDFLPLAAQGGIFIALVIAAAVFDFHRKNL